MNTLKITINLRSYVMAKNTLYAIRSKEGFIVKDERTGQLEIYDDWESACHSIRRSTDEPVAVDVTRQEEQDND
jgi:hypothetical protein